LPEHMALRYAHLVPEHLSNVAARIERKWDNVAAGATIEVK